MSIQSRDTARASIILVQVIGWVAYAMSTYFAMLPKLTAPERAPHLIANSLRTLIGVAVTVALWALYRQLPEFRRKSGTVTLVVTVASVAGGAAWLAAYVWMVLPVVQPDAVPPWGWPAFPRSSLDHAFVLLAWSAAYFALRFWRDAQQHERRAIAASAQAFELEIHLLKQKLDSHFLFNALTSIKAAIPSTAHVARSMLDQFAEFLRLALRTSSLSTVRLSQELELAGRYLAIEKLRLEERLSYDIRSAPDVQDVRVPGMLLQPLVENAVRHGASSARLHVEIVASRQEDAVTVRVSNTGTLAASTRADRDGLTSGGFGLDYVRQRLARMGAGRAVLRVLEQDDRVHAVLEIPLEDLRDD